MRMPHQAPGVRRGGWTGASEGRIEAAQAIFAARAPIGVGGGLNSIGGTVCRLGCGAAYAACVAGCAGLTGPGAAVCAALCTVLYDECKAGCPSVVGGGGGLVAI